METILPDKIRSGLSGILFATGYIFIYIFLQCMLALAFGEQYQYLTEALIVFPPIGIVIGFLAGLIQSKKMKILIQDYTISQNKSHVALKSVSCKNIPFGIQLYDDAKHKICCTGFHFTKENIDRLKQTIKCDTPLNPIATTPVDPK